MRGFSLEGLSVAQQIEIIRELIEDVAVSIETNLEERGYDDEESLEDAKKAGQMLHFRAERFAELEVVIYEAMGIEG